MKIINLVIFFPIKRIIFIFYEKPTSKGNFYYLNEKKKIFIKIVNFDLITVDSILI